MRVSAYNGVALSYGKTMPSNTPLVHPGGAPEPPSRVEVEAASPTALTISWSPPNDAMGVDVWGYQVVSKGHSFGQPTGLGIHSLHPRSEQTVRFRVDNVFTARCLDRRVMGIAVQCIGALSGPDQYTTQAPKLIAVFLPVSVFAVALNARNGTAQGEASSNKSSAFLMPCPERSG